jgi:bacterioferritin (cytochrome b1)
MQGDEQVVELLNEALTADLTAVNQYFLDAKMFDELGHAHLDADWLEMQLALINQIGEAHYLAQQIRG